MIPRVVVVRSADVIGRTLLALKKLNPSLPKKGSRILIKPNLVEPMPSGSGAITRPEIIEGIIRFLGDSSYEILVGEGSAHLDTFECFRVAGYDGLESRYAIKLVDLNKGEFSRVKGDFWSFEINSMVKEVDYVISAAVLKGHAFEVTLTLKNLMGFLKPIGGYPVKAYMHPKGDIGAWARRLCDLAKAIKPNLGVIDATTGMFGSHVYGRIKRFDATIASEDLVACDRVGARMLGHEEVLHLKLAAKAGIGSEKLRVIELTQV
jgi:uncharacterized protein (DUF362 family)